MSEWHYEHLGQKFGPISIAALKRLAIDGGLDPSDLIWREGMPQWVKASETKGLFPEPAPVGPTGKAADIGPAPVSRLPIGMPAMPDSDDRPRAKWLYSLPFWLSLAALVISVATAIWTMVSDPLGSGLSNYDFSSPEQALRSSLAIEINHDIRAQLEFDRLVLGKKRAEKLKTLKIHRESEYQGKKLLFVSFEQNGIPRKDVEAFDKDADTGIWTGPMFMRASEIQDADLREAVDKWENTVGSGE
jgi:hypothetical protein